MDANAVASFQKKVVQHPEVFFTPSEEVAQEIKSFTKHVFDHCTQFVSRTAATPLDQLYIDGFDADQIWEQLRLQNAPLLEELKKRIRGFKKQPAQIRLFPEETEDVEEDDEESDEQSDDEEEEELARSEDEAAEDELPSDDEDEEEEDAPKKKKTTKKDAATTTKSKKSKKARDVAEDGFFDWEEMDKLAEEEEEDDEDDDDLLGGGDEEEGEDDGDEDPLEDDSEDDDMEDDDELDDDEAANMKFDDFFDEPNVTRKRRGQDEDEEEDDDEEEDEEEMEVEDDEEEDEFDMLKRSGAPQEEDDVDEDEVAERGILSSHQRQRQRLTQEIKQLEKEALAEKPWALKGEVKSAARPENSLLEAILDYDRPVKAAPVITVEVSVALEEMIKKRILEDDYDDVIRKFAANEQDDKKKLADVSMEKSTEGLGEIYEKEYMKTSMGFEADDGSKKDQDEIEIMFKSLCWKLDALSNYQFTPKPMVKELQVKPSVPAIAMEEIVPISVSDANLQAPEEIYAKKRKRGEAVLQNKEEMSQNERKAQRNAKKRVRRKANKQQEADERLVAKINPGLGNKYEKKKMLESIASAKNITTGKQIEGSTKQFSNSKEFFTRLQEEVQSDIRKKAGDAK